MHFKQLRVAALCLLIIFSYTCLCFAVFSSSSGEPQFGKAGDNISIVGSSVTVNVTTMNITAVEVLKGTNTELTIKSTTFEDDINISVDSEKIIIGAENQFVDAPTLEIHSYNGLGGDNIYRIFDSSGNPILRGGFSYDVQYDTSGVYSPGDSAVGLYTFGSGFADTKFRFFSPMLFDTGANATFTGTVYADAGIQTVTIGSDDGTINVDFFNYFEFPAGIGTGFLLGSEGTRLVLKSDYDFAGDTVTFSIQASTHTKDAIIEVWTSDISGQENIGVLRMNSIAEEFQIYTIGAAGSIINFLQSLKVDDAKNATITGTLYADTDVQVGGDIIITGTVDGRDVAADGVTLDAVIIATVTLRTDVDSKQNELSTPTWKAYDSGLLDGEDYLWFLSTTAAAATYLAAADTPVIRKIPIYNGYAMSDIWNSSDTANAYGTWWDNAGIDANIDTFHIYVASATTDAFGVWFWVDGVFKTSATVAAGDNYHAESVASFAVEFSTTIGIDFTDVDSSDPPGGVSVCAELE